MEVKQKAEFQVPLGGFRGGFPGGIVTFIYHLGYGRT